MRPSLPIAARRLGVTAATLLCAGLQLGSALHHVIVEHAHCAEHGELTHAHAEHVAYSHGDEPVEHDGAAFTAGDRDDGGHEHCPVAHLTRAEVPTPGAVPSPVLEAQVVDHVFMRGVAPAIATLLAAPKTSPPA